MVGGNIKAKDFSSLAILLKRIMVSPTNFNCTNLPVPEFHHCGPELETISMRQWVVILIGSILVALCIWFFHGSQVNLMQNDSHISEKISESMFVPVQTDDESEPTTAQLKVIEDRFLRIKANCGDICQTSIEQTRSTPSKWYDHVIKKFDCQTLFRNQDFDAYATLSKPTDLIPDFMLQDYSYQGRANIFQWFMDESGGGNAKIYWKENDVEKIIRKIRRGNFKGFGYEAGEEIYRHIRDQMNVTNKHVLIIGSRAPWLEAIFLFAGVGHITTLEYAKIYSKHPKITAMVPPDFSQMYLNGTLPLFDIVATYSSIEHSGLGRYGDGLNPFGDLIAMARAWCVLKEGGHALVGVPSGADGVAFNVHRIYGPVMYSHLFANWEQIYTETDPKIFTRYRDGSFIQTLHLLRKNSSLLSL
eukprot:maker-scaffold345_size201316-snap-gene-1.21 protein:Tk12166 transcript:maker-scaffold345_size201316-snap-gene-1.21-mRNA-1 annotation:"hypothetical protein GUITHDRAFT_82324"